MRTLMMIWTFECSVAEDLLHLTACKHALRLILHDEIISHTHPHKCNGSLPRLAHGRFV